MSTIEARSQTIAETCLVLRKCGDGPHDIGPPQLRAAAALIEELAAQRNAARADAAAFRAAADSLRELLARVAGHIGGGIAVEPSTKASKTTL